MPTLIIGGNRNEIITKFPPKLSADQKTEISRKVMEKFKTINQIKPAVGYIEKGICENCEKPLFENVSHVCRQPVLCNSDAKVRRIKPKLPSLNFSDNRVIFILTAIAGFFLAFFLLRFLR